mgnify:CR=1 FL=1
MRQTEQILLKMPDTKQMFAAGGFGFAGSSPNQGILFAQLKDFKDRNGRGEHSAKALLGQLLRRVQPDYRGDGDSRSCRRRFKGWGSSAASPTSCSTRAAGRSKGLEATAQQLIAQGNRTPGLTGLFTQFTATDPQIVVKIDREQAKSLGMSLADVTNTMQILLGSTQRQRLRLQQPFVPRLRPGRPAVSIESGGHRAATTSAPPPGTDDAAQQHRLGERGDGAQERSPISTCSAPPTINGSAAPGFSSGQALTTMASLSDRALPQGFSYAWSGLSLEEIKAGSQSAAIFGLGLLLVYLTLAGQYESLTLPFIILLSVPLAILGALLAQWGRGLINDVYCQIGLVMLIGLSAKNGILVVEFAEQLRARGMSIAEAAVEAARIRLRPILMTSLAFILGVMPLVVASGAGREARHSVGTAVAGGMVASTFLNLAFIPVLYVMVKSFGRRRS